MKGKRNVSIILGYLVVCMFYAWIAGPENIGDIGEPLVAIGISVGLGVGARAANKFAEAKAGEVQ